MERYFDLISSNSETLLNFIVNSAWPGFLFAGLVWVVLYFARRVDAASRYRVWGVAILFLVAAPLAMSPIPSAVGNWTGSLFTERASMPDHHAPGGMAYTVTDNASEPLSTPGSSRVEPANEGNYRRATGSLFSGVSLDSRFAAAQAFNAGRHGVSSIDFSEILLGMLPISLVSLWALFSLYLLGRIGRSIYEVALIKKSMEPLRSDYAALIDRIVRFSGARRKAVIGISPLVKIPVSIGFFRPVIIFPSHLIDRLDFEEIRTITLHELAHIQRYDDWSNLFQKLVQAVLFFHPAVILIGRQMDLEREIACDEWVVANTGHPKQYARTLTRLVQLTSENWNPLLASGAALYKKQLYKRLEQILSSRKKSRSRLSRLRVLMMAGILALTVVLTVQIAPVIALPGNAVSFYELSNTIKEGWREASAFIPGVVYDDQMDEGDDYDRMPSLASISESSDGIISIAPIKKAELAKAFRYSYVTGNSNSSWAPFSITPRVNLPDLYIVGPNGGVKQVYDTKSENGENTESRFRYKYFYGLGDQKLGYVYDRDAIKNSDWVKKLSPDKLPLLYSQDGGADGDIVYAAPDGSVYNLSSEQLAAITETKAKLAAKQGMLAAIEGAVAAKEGVAAVKEAELREYLKNTVKDQVNTLSLEDLEHLSDLELEDMFEANAQAYADLDDSWVSDLVDAAGEIVSNLGDGNTLSINDNDMTWTYRDGSHKIRIEVEGEIELSDDARTIESLEDGGFISIYERKDGVTRKYEAETKNGILHEAYYEDRNRTDMNDDAREWVGEMLLKMVRRSGIGAEARVKRLYEQQGFDAVLTEIEEVKSGHVVRKYVDAAFALNLSKDEKLRLVRALPELFSSDYDLAETLIDISDECKTDDDLMTAYMEAVKELHSDYETRRVVSELSLHGTKNPRVMKMAMEVAMDMSSDYEKAEYLIGLAKANDNSFDLSEGYLQAIESLSSSHEKGRVLKSLILSGEISEEYVADVLKFAGNIESDYDKAELLIFTAKHLGIDEGLFELYVDALSDMHSDHDIKRTLFALGSMERAGDKALIKIFDVIDYMNSDYDKAELLIGYGQQAMRNEETAKAYLRALEEINSDYDMSRVFASVLRHNDLSDDFILGSLILVEDMSGDYDKSRVLKMMSDRCRGNEKLETAYVDAIESIGSDYERDKLYADLYKGKRDKR